MSARISRRQVLAAIALAADLPTPRDVAFVEADRAGDSPRLAVDLDSIADLHAWLPFFGMTEKRVLSQPYTHKVGPQAGQTTTLANAYSHIDEDWRGWRVHLTATDPVSEANPELDDATREQLATITNETAVTEFVQGMRDKAAEILTDQLRQVADEPAPHRQVAGSVGAPGQCSAECSCGVVFDGFDTAADASAMLDDHIDAAAAKAGAV